MTDRLTPEDAIVHTAYCESEAIIRRLERKADMHAAGGFLLGVLGTLIVLALIVAMRAAGGS